LTAAASEPIAAPPTDAAAPSSAADSSSAIVAPTASDAASPAAPLETAPRKRLKLVHRHRVQVFPADCMLFRCDLLPLWGTLRPAVKAAAGVTDAAPTPPSSQPSVIGSAADAIVASEPVVPVIAAAPQSGVVAMDGVIELCPSTETGAANQQA